MGGETYGGIFISICPSLTKAIDVKGHRNKIYQKRLVDSFTRHSKNLALEFKTYLSVDTYAHTSVTINALSPVLKSYHINILKFNLVVSIYSVNKYNNSKMNGWKNTHDFDQ